MHLRVHNGYALIEINKLDESYRKSLSDMVDLEIYRACLLPKDQNSGLTIKLLDENIFNFLDNLQDGDNGEHFLASEERDLIIDRVLEVKVDGAFTSGPEAMLALGQQISSPERASLVNAIDNISLRAIRYAMQLHLSNAMSLSARLYFYNRRPLSPELAQNSIKDPESGLKALQIEKAINDLQLNKDWETRPMPGDYDRVWKAWKRKGEKSGKVEKYKLYISCQYELLPDIIHDILSSLEVSTCYQFKVGKRLVDILRPDYFIAYFKTYAGMIQAAQQLTPILENVEPQGVPFTASLISSGVLSWGIDPPKTKKISGWMTDELSWRIWITNRLATSILNAKQGMEKAEDIANFALERLEAEGINTEQWCQQKYTVTET